MSNINVSLDNPYGEVTIPRAKLHPSEDVSMVIANPMALDNDENPYGAQSPAPPPYLVKEADPEEEGGGQCCYRCRRRK
ncbi:hypothetical protein PBY51_023015 [Eleginops maclovinus]|uniref:Uncharacterized protein n=1 Tax=Eleginops maclovinus TaxID=56733 RepID=A0AAN7X1F3_ELEMC|nr:hypothetical protein PBY51_023015 [Eleginops maclovinus]